MNFKKIIIVAVSISFLLFSGSCKMIDFKKGTSYLNKTARISGNGKTPGTAIVLTPTINFKTSQSVTITVNDNIRWFYVNTLPGLSYHFETVGKGDSSISVYKESKVTTSGSISGEPEKYDNDGAADKNNAKVVISGMGGKYLKVQLYAGSKWSGSMKYKKN